MRLPQYDPKWFGTGIGHVRKAAAAFQAAGYKYKSTNERTGRTIKSLGKREGITEETLAEKGGKRGLGQGVTEKSQSWIIAACLES